VCECPVVNGVQFAGDGYVSCTGRFFSLAIRSLRLEVPVPV
jgi:hypothetical protein